MNQRLKRWIVIAMLILSAIVISVLESFIPMAIDGIKLGLANIIILIMLYEFKPYEAFIVDAVRIIVVALIRGNLGDPIFILSVAGGISSFLIMLIFSKLKGFSIVATSILGSVFHMAGQILTLMIFIEINEIVIALPFLSIIAVATGLITGIVAREYLKRGITSRYLDVNRVLFDNDKKNTEEK